MSTSPAWPDHCRFLHVHRNTPGVLGRINAVFSARALNVSAQFLQTEGDLGYVVIDAERCPGGNDQVLAALIAIDGTIRVRAMSN